MYTDPISDYLTRLRNALKANKKTVEVPCSKEKLGISEILKKNSFISDYEKADTPNKQGKIIIKLKYKDKESVIIGLKRISKPGLRSYSSSKDIPRVLNGLGIAIVSTSKGLMTDKEARVQRIGGEVICNVW